ncbi:MAG: hypothetical protein MUF25_15350, partial [Pirellulaceae bacterium]|nr:hypothetical protein [Pirellulaceae bacterium]
TLGIQTCGGAGAQPCEAGGQGCAPPGGSGGVREAIRGPFGGICAEVGSRRACCCGTSSAGGPNTLETCALYAAAGDP